ncbi:Sec-independent protein translocase protein TatA [Candidatus Zixiibacteriota bacterium]|nr:Sec-independent protein translocase protein TatA [candidate division Zixibacteria bacterium]
MLGWQELILIFLVVLLLFGAKRIPDIAQGLGKGIREFKRALKDTEDDVKTNINDVDKKKPDTK